MWPMPPHSIPSSPIQKPSGISPTLSTSNQDFVDLSSDDAEPKYLAKDEQLMEFKAATSLLLRKQKKLKTQLAREKLRREELLSKLTRILHENITCAVAQDVMIRCWTLRCGHTFRIDALVGIFNHALIDACRSRGIPINRFPVPQRGPFRPMALAYFKRKLRYRTAVHYKCPICRERIVTKPLEVIVLRDLLADLVGVIESDETAQRALERSHREAIAQQVEEEYETVDWSRYFF